MTSKKAILALNKYKNYFETQEQEKMKLQQLKQNTKVSNKHNRFFKQPIVEYNHDPQTHPINNDIVFIKKKLDNNDLLGKLINKNEFLDKNTYDDEDVFDVNELHRRNIKVINNVYQPRYKSDVKATGFGDFIRGCYYLINFCETYNFECKILVNHPVKKYLKKYKDGPMYPGLNNVEFFIPNNYRGQTIDSTNVIHVLTGKKINGAFVEHLTDNVRVIDGCTYIYNIVYPGHDISDKHKEYMRTTVLEPTDDMVKLVHATLTNLRLTKKEYTIIHVRSGDKYLKGTSIDFEDDYVTRLTREIFGLINKNIGLVPITNYLVLSDNTEIKHRIKRQFPSLKMLFNDITHFGGGEVQEDARIRNTMLEFNLMSQSSYIFSFSCYEHGSGFSQWCAETYNIPYVSTYMKC